MATNNCYSFLYQNITSDGICTSTLWGCDSHDSFRPMINAGPVPCITKIIELNLFQQPVISQLKCQYILRTIYRQYISKSAVLSLGQGWIAASVCSPCYFQYSTVLYINSTAYNTFNTQYSRMRCFFMIKLGAVNELRSQLYWRGVRENIIWV